MVIFWDFHKNGKLGCHGWDERLQHWRVDGNMVNEIVFLILRQSLFLLCFLIQYGRIWQLFLIWRESGVAIDGVRDCRFEMRGGALREIVCLLWGPSFLHCIPTLNMGAYGNFSWFGANKWKVGLPWMGSEDGVRDCRFRVPMVNESNRFFCFGSVAFLCISLLNMNAYWNFSWFGEAFEVSMARSCFCSGTVSFLLHFLIEYVATWQFFVIWGRNGKLGCHGWDEGLHI